MIYGIVKVKKVDPMKEDISIEVVINLQGDNNVVVDLKKVVRNIFDIEENYEEDIDKVNKAVKNIMIEKIELLNG